MQHQMAVLPLLALLLGAVLVLVLVGMVLACSHMAWLIGCCLPCVRL